MRTSCQPLIFIVSRAIIGSNECQYSFLLFYLPPSCSPLRSRLPRNNNSGNVHQHSFMAPHYAKRHAKGAWHFLPVRRRIRKDRLRLPSLAFFFFLFNGVPRSCAIIVLQPSWLVRRSNPVAIRKTRCISNCQEASIRQELVHRCQACIVYCQVPLPVDVSMYRTYWHATLSGERLYKLYWYASREWKRCGRATQQLAPFPLCAYMDASYRWNDLRVGWKIRWRMVREETRAAHI